MFRDGGWYERVAGEVGGGRHLWRRLQAEWRASRGEIRKNSTGNFKGHSMDRKDRVILYIHGGTYFVFSFVGLIPQKYPGAYFMFSAATHRMMTIQLSKHLNARLFGTFLKSLFCSKMIDELHAVAIDYRLAPETRFPGQLLDVVSSYMRLLEDLHHSSREHHHCWRQCRWRLNTCTSVVPPR